MNARLERRLAVANWILWKWGNFSWVVFTGKATEATTATARTSTYQTLHRNCMMDALMHTNVTYLLLSSYSSDESDLSSSSRFYSLSLNLRSDALCPSLSLCLFVLLLFGWGWRLAASLISNLDLIFWLLPSLRRNFLKGQNGPFWWNFFSGFYVTKQTSLRKYEIHLFVTTRT